jgi:Uma2 family endonuclease
MVVAKGWAVGEVGHLPDDGVRYALIEGLPYRMPPPKPRRGPAPSQANRHLGNAIEQRGFGALSDQRGFILARDPNVLLGPDPAVVRGDRVPTDEDAYPFLAPDLVVPVVSPSCPVRPLD